MGRGTGPDGMRQGNEVGQCPDSKWGRNGGQDTRAAKPAGDEVTFALTPVCAVAGNRNVSKAHLRYRVRFFQVKIHDAGEFGTQMP